MNRDFRAKFLTMLADHYFKALAAAFLLGVFVEWKVFCG